MARKEPFRKDSLDLGLSISREESHAGSNQASYRRWANMQFKNMRVELGKAGRKGRDVAGPEPEVLVAVNKGTN